MNGGQCMRAGTMAAMAAAFLSAGILIAPALAQDAYVVELPQR